MFGFLTNEYFSLNKEKESRPLIQMSDRLHADQAAAAPRREKTSILGLKLAYRTSV